MAPPPRASGDGFAPSEAALAAALDAAEDIWFHDERAATTDDRLGGWRRAGAGAGAASPPPRARIRATNGGDSTNADTPKKTSHHPSSSSWTPWRALCDVAEAPYFRWYAGAKTNACFNALDRHLADGRGDDVALTCVQEDGAGETYSVTRRELLGEVVRAAKALKETHGLKARDRVLFHAPTDATHVVYMLACARLGVTYSATAVDSVTDVLSSRAADLTPRVAIAPDARATHGGVAVDCAEKLRDALATHSADAAGGGRCKVVTVAPWRASAPHVASYLAMSDADALRAAFTACPCVPVETDHPLFVSYTSGSTGKPKGVVHGHGGYVAGVKQSMKVVFETTEGEGCDGVSGRGGGILTVGSAGWITGQSYMVWAPLCAGVRSVMMLGSPVYPTPLRTAQTVAREKCTLLKTGSAVIRQLMTDPGNAAKLDAIDTSSLRYATFCAEPVSVEVHEYAHRHITKKFINSYWATEHGGMVFSRNTTSGGADKPIAPDARTWPLPWVKVALDEETSDVVIAGPYPSLALTVFGDPESVNDPKWRGDLARYQKTYWPKNGGGFVQGDIARVAGKDGGFTFHGRSDEVINVNGNRVGTEQIERCLWDVETTETGSGESGQGGGAGAGGDADATTYRVKDCCVVGAPDFVKGTAPVAFVVFERRGGGGKKSKRGGGAASKAASRGPDLAAFKLAAATAVTDRVGAYAAPDHVFAVDALPKTITNKTSRKTLQLLLAGDDAPDGSLAKKETLPPIAAMVADWRLTGASTSHAINLRRYWNAFTFSDHNVLGKPIVPGAGWLCVLANEMKTEKLADVSFMRGVHDARADVRVVKRRRTMQATVGDDVVLKASVVAGEATPRAIGPTLFARSENARPAAAAAAADEAMDTGSDGSDRSDGEKESSDDASDPDPDRDRDRDRDDPVITEDATHAQHYRRCGALKLNYGGAYRAVSKVEWSGHVFRADVDGTHLAAVLDAGLQVACAAVRGNTFIPVGVGEFHITEGVDAWKPGGKCVAHGEITEQHNEFLIADLRYERLVVGASAGGAGGSKKRKSASSAASSSPGYKTFAAMSRVRFARVEGTKPRLQPAAARHAPPPTGAAQILDPKTALDRLRHLTPEQREDAIRAVVRGVVVDLTDVEPDFDKTVFDNGMHSLNAVELLTRVNDALGTGVTSKLVVVDAPMSHFVTAVAQHAAEYEAPKEGEESLPFPNVDYDNLNEIVRRRLAGKTVGKTPYVFLAKFMAYNWWRKSFQFFRIGGLNLFLNPPKKIDLGIEVRMDRRVEFRDLDMNQHYTVEMIVGRSVDGVEQLMLMSGLTLVELYYKRNLFAAKIQSTFHKELAHNDRYTIHTKITRVAGSLMDIRVAFLDADETLCFEILWTILIVLDSNERILLDWENVDLMEGRTLTAGPGKNRVEAPATPKSPGPGGGGSLLGSALPPFLGGERSKTIAEAAGTTKSSKKKTKKKR